MLLSELINVQSSGALNIKYEKGSSVASLGGTQVTMEQAAVIARQLGWNEFYLNAFEILDKTNKFVRGIKSNVANDYIIANTQVEFTNSRSNTYGKTYDRIHMYCPNCFEISVIYGMEGNSSPYVIYDSKTSVPVSKCRNLKKVGEYITTLV
jgi:hypothetical protein